MKGRRMGTPWKWERWMVPFVLLVVGVALLFASTTQQPPVVKDAFDVQTAFGVLGTLSVTVSLVWTLVMGISEMLL